MVRLTCALVVSVGAFACTGSVDGPPAGADAAGADVGQSTGGSPDAGEPPPDAAVACVDSPPTSTLADDAVMNDDPAFIQVLTTNIENLKTAEEFCAGDWGDLFHYLVANRPRPDLVLAQQVENQAQLDYLVGFMSDRLGVPYAGIIAEPEPAPWDAAVCPEKAQQTNAIIYRTTRFTPVGAKQTWQAKAMLGGSCVPSPIARMLRSEAADGVAAVPDPAG